MPRQPTSPEDPAPLPERFAHQLNNLLAAMMVYTDLADQEATRPAEVRKYLALMRKAIRSARESLHQIQETDPDRPSHD